MIENIDDLIKEPTQDLGLVFQQRSQTFLKKLIDCLAHQNWTELINLQVLEINSVLKAVESTSTSNNHQSSEHVNSISNATEISSENEISKIKVFSPLVLEKSQIKCSVKGCKGRFAYKRSYVSHMKTFHGDDEIKSFCDPPGTCQLISKKTNRPCLAKLPYNSIYNHMKVFHDVSKDNDNHILLGFDMSSNPKPVFGKKNYGYKIVDSKIEFIPNHPNKYQGPCSSSNEETMSSFKNMDGNSTATNSAAGNITNPVEDNKTESCSSLGITGDYQSSESVNVIFTPNNQIELEETSKEICSDTPKSTKPGKIRRRLSIVLPLTVSPDHNEESSADSSQNVDDELSAPDSSSQDSQMLEIDSDYEDGDNDNYTEMRQNNKKIRHINRNNNLVPLHQKDSNSKFISDMIEFMKMNTIDTTNKNTSTIKKTVRNLFSDTDSLLAFQVEKQADFNLEKWRNFESSEFQHIMYPLEWLAKTCDRNGGKGVERLKVSD